MCCLAYCYCWYRWSEWNNGAVGWMRSCLVMCLWDVDSNLARVKFACYSPGKGYGISWLDKCEVFRWGGVGMVWVGCWFDSSCQWCWKWCGREKETKSRRRRKRMRRCGAEGKIRMRKMWRRRSRRRKRGKGEWRGGGEEEEEAETFTRISTSAIITTTVNEKRQMFRASRRI